MIALWYALAHFMGADYGLPYGHWGWYNFHSGFGSGYVAIGAGFVTLIMRQGRHHRERIAQSARQHRDLLEQAALHHEESKAHLAQHLAAHCSDLKEHLEAVARAKPPGRRM